MNEEILEHGEGVFEELKPAQYFNDFKININEQFNKDMFINNVNKEIVCILGGYKSGKTKFINMLTQLD